MFFEGRFFELVSELGNGHFVPYGFIRDNDLDRRVCDCNGSRWFVASGSIARRDSKFPAKSQCRVGVGGVVLPVGCP